MLCYHVIQAQTSFNVSTLTFQKRPDLQQETITRDIFLEHLVVGIKCKRSIWSSWRRQGTWDWCERPPPDGNNTKQDKLELIATRFGCKSGRSCGFFIFWICGMRLIDPFDKLKKADWFGIWKTTLYQNIEISKAIEKILIY